MCDDCPVKKEFDNLDELTIPELCDILTAAVGGISRNLPVNDCVLRAWVKYKKVDLCTWISGFDKRPKVMYDDYREIRPASIHKYLWIKIADTAACLIEKNFKKEQKEMILLKKSNKKLMALFAEKVAIEFLPTEKQKQLA